MSLGNFIENIKKFGLENILSRYYGRYLAEVVNTEDAKGVHRLKVKVFAIDEVEPLPVWAIYSSPWAGKDFGANFPVRVGDFVWVSFEYGDLDYPIWHSGNFAEGDVPEQINSNKKMGFVSRDKHYDVLDEEAKSWKREMASGSHIEMAEKDINIHSEQHINTTVKKNFNVTVDEHLMALIKKNVDITVKEALTATVTNNAKFDAKNIALVVAEKCNLGADVGTYSIVWGEVVDSFLNQFVAIFNAHVHTSPFFGIPTSPSLISVGAVPNFLSQKVKTV